MATLLFAILHVRGWLLIKVSYVTFEWPSFCQLFSRLLFAVIDSLDAFDSRFDTAGLFHSKCSSKVVKRLVDIVLITAFFYGDFTPSSSPYSNAVLLLAYWSTFKYDLL
jgi:hypothetical protein